ncbi:alpha/beta hydrolase [Chitinophaga sp.]|uniref:alpha/beta fold hydrolase n=1 Tax=Chitinophaga sp. TaxID=1869181 RepID=UPI002F92F0CE
MSNSVSKKFKHNQIMVNGISTHLIEIGNKDKQPVLFLHGYPENWMEFEQVMILLQEEYYLLAIDLPGIGKTEEITATDKRTIADFVKALIEILALKDVVLVGHDVGGMISYAFIRHFSRYLSKAVIICTAIPGVAPWEDVKRNPYIWHFAFFAVPELPEKLIQGKQNLLFDYFYNTISANKDAISTDKRKRYSAAYSSPVALSTSLGWYRSFYQDEKENAKNTTVEIPVLYLKGAKDSGNIDDYMEGFKASGLTNIRGVKIAESGHFAPEEQPETVSKAIAGFIKES